MASNTKPVKKSEATVGGVVQPSREWAVGDTWHHDLPDEDLSPAWKKRLDQFNKEQKHSHESQSIPFLKPPLTCQFYFPDILGGGSSLAHYGLHNHRSATTSDLFLDLVFVFVMNSLVGVTMTKTRILQGMGGTSGEHRLLSQGNKTHESSVWDDSNLGSQVWLTLRDTIALYIPIYLTWLHLSSMLNRFEKSDVVHLLLMGVNMIVLVFLGRSTDQCAGEDVDIGAERAICKTFVTYLAVVQFIVVCYYQYARAFNRALHGRWINELSLWHLSYGIGWLLVRFVGIANFEATGDPALFLSLWWIVVAMELGFYISRGVSCGKRLMKDGFGSLLTCGHRCCKSAGICWQDLEGHRFIPINTHVMTERLDLMLILAFGEVIAGCDVKGLIKETSENSLLLKIFYVVFFGLGFKYLAFDYAEHPSITKTKSQRKPGDASHAFSTSSGRGITFIFAMMTTTLGVLLVASMLELNIHHDGLQTKLGRYVLGIACFLVMASTTVVQLVHKGKQGGGRRFSKQVRLVTRSAFCILALVCPMLDIYDSMFGANLCQGILLFLLYGMLITDGWMRYHKKEEGDLHHRHLGIPLLGHTTNGGGEGEVPGADIQQTLSTELANRPRPGKNSWMERTKA